MKNWLDPIVLTGSQVELIPLEASHREGLVSAARDGKLWELWYTNIPSEDAMADYIRIALLEREQGKSLPFVVLRKSDRKVIGSTRFLNAKPQHKRVEIGATWYAKSFQRTGVNTECKYLMLTYAFEQLGAVAVEFRTHWHNHPSRNAILRLGAKQDGVLRNHRIDPSGGFRDTVVFSIIQLEWPVVKKSLEFNMDKYSN